MIWTVPVTTGREDNEGEDRTVRSVCGGSRGQVSEGSDALGHPVAPPVGRVLHRVILQRAQVTVALPAPHTLELALPGVCALVLAQVLALLEALVAVLALVRLLPGVDAPVPVQVRGVLEALLALGAFQGLLPGGVAAVLHELRGGEEAAVAQRALERPLLAVGALVPLQRGALLVAFAADVAFVGLVR